MSRKSVLAALMLISAGIVFGAIVVSNFDGGLSLGLAQGGGDVKIGGTPPVMNVAQDVPGTPPSFAGIAGR